jgi:hypothetical protein
MGAVMAENNSDREEVEGFWAGDRKAMPVLSQKLLVVHFDSVSEPKLLRYIVTPLMKGPSFISKSSQPSTAVLKLFGLRPLLGC